MLRKAWCFGGALCIALSFSRCVYAPNTSPWQTRTTTTRIGPSPVASAFFLTGAYVGLLVGSHIQDCYIERRQQGEEVCAGARTPEGEHDTLSRIPRNAKKDNSTQAYRDSYETCVRLCSHLAADNVRYVQQVHQDMVASTNVSTPEGVCIATKESVYQQQQYVNTEVHRTCARIEMLLHELQYGDLQESCCELRSELTHLLEHSDRLVQNVPEYLYDGAFACEHTMYRTILRMARHSLDVLQEVASHTDQPPHRTCIRHDNCGTACGDRYDWWQTRHVSDIYTYDVQPHRRQSSTYGTIPENAVARDDLWIRAIPYGTSAVCALAGYGLYHMIFPNSQ